MSSEKTLNYPSIPQVIQWMTAHANATDPKHWVLPPVLTDPTEKEIVEFFVAVSKKACDWQREQDALICIAQEYTDGYDDVHDFANEQFRKCAAAIRAGDSNV